jgi:uncharacterized protein
MAFASRRDFLKTFSAAAAVSATDFNSCVAFPMAAEDRLPPTDFFTNRDPLAKSSFYPLPLTSIRPKRWLLNQLEIQANGLSGHLDEFWPDVGSESGWLGGNGESWERGPYFLDGLVPLAYLLQDKRLIAKSQKWVNWVLEHQQADGMIGPARNDDWWPRIVMLKVLTQYQEATADPRVVPLMQRYFTYQLRELPNRLLRDWGRYRWQDEVVSVLWLYNRTGDSGLLHLAEILHQQGYDWRGEFENFAYTSKTNAKELGLHEGAPISDRAMQTHGVNNAMALKSSALWWLLSKDQSYRAGVNQQLAALDAHHGIPNGMFSADEHLAGKNPSQGIELCAVVENMFSLEHAMAILGDPLLGDRLEKIAFNALPGTFTDDMWAHQYDQEPNQIQCSLSQRPWTTNGPESNLYGLDPNFGCCTANMHQGWPKFTSHLWMSSADGGVAAVVYAPCELSTKIRNVCVTIAEQTGYPFDGNILLAISPNRSVQFPLSLRIPAWAAEPSIRVNGKPIESVCPGSFAVINREWKPRDQVELHFPMRPSVSRSYQNSVVIERGPIIFSLDILTEWRKLRTRGMTADWEAYPKSAWNYALDINERTIGSAREVKRTSSERGVFTAEGVPIHIEVQGKKIPQWQEEHGWAGELPQSPTTSAEPQETLRLVPYGAAKLRITAFPELGEHSGAAAK